MKKTNKNLKQPIDGLVRVLVVDDNYTSRIILKEILNNFGFLVTEACTGQEAIAKVIDAARDNMPYKLVFMDWNMPGMDGSQAARLIHSDHNISEMPVIIMVTAHGRADVMHDAVVAEVDGFLVKPVTSALLRSTLKEILDWDLPSNNSGSEEKKTLNDKDSLTGARILLVEDDEINQDLVTEFLQNAGMDVVLAENGQQAIDRLLYGKQGFDGVLMDLRMPIMDGYAATRKIRGLNLYRDLPIIAMTASQDEAEKKSALSAGANDHLQKPISAQQLYRCMASWITPLLPYQEAMDFEASGSASANKKQLLPDLEGIDTKSGLSRVEGNISLYKKLLLKFFNRNQNLLENLSNLLESGKYLEAQHIVHTVRGVAGNIGANILYIEAGNLEQVLRSDIPSQWHDVYEEFAQQLERVLMALGQLGAEEKTQITRSRHLSRSDAVNLLGDVIILLESDLVLAKSYLFELDDFFHDSSYQKVVEIIQQRVEEYDFDSAIKHIHFLMEDLNSRQETA